MDNTFTVDGVIYDAQQVFDEHADEVFCSKNGATGNWDVAVSWSRGGRTTYSASTQEEARLYLAKEYVEKTLSVNILVPKELIEEIIDWITDNDYECGFQGDKIYVTLTKLLKDSGQ